MFYSLQPHADSICQAVESIEVEVQRTPTTQASQALILRYIIAGKVTDLAIPERTMPRRTDELWQRTCCEAFIASLDSDEYLELNFSPSTQWAAYRFSNYRQGMRVAADVKSHSIKVVRDDSRLEMEIAMELRDPIFVIPAKVGIQASNPGLDARLHGHDEQNIQSSMRRSGMRQSGMRMGLCAVIEDRDGRKSYWALAHPTGKPDFHHPSSFTASVL